MNLKIQIIVALFICLALVVIVDMIRKRALELRYALAWLIVGISVLIMDLFPGLIEWLSKAMGIETPANMLFFLGFCFSLGIIFVLTLAISRMSNRIKKLAQELALYKQNDNSTMKEEE